MKFDFEMIGRLGAYHQTPDAMLRLPTKKNVEELDIIDVNTPTSDGQTTDNNNGARVSLITQDSVSISTAVEMPETRIGKPYCLNIRTMVGTAQI